ncbi:MAG: hypothetical protein C0603_05650 [Denitrovibrio sp.]|nr:MAG: hypothetical protein C0603_05650 [Denitrovibrio sp.]
MIAIAGITMPDCSIWHNEMEYGMPISNIETCTEGNKLVYSSGYDRRIDIYIPKIAGELTRQTVSELKALADNGGIVHLSINDRQMQAVFRHEDSPLELKPISAKQVQESGDSYYGMIKLLEV